MRLAAGHSVGGGGFPDPGADFPRFVLGKCLLYLRRDLESWAPAIFRRLAESRSTTAGAGNRTSGIIVRLDGGPDLFARHSRRGGLIRFLFRDVYFGGRPRPVTELSVAAEAYRRGIPISEPMGAMVKWVAPSIYRGAFLTRAMVGMTLWEFMRTDDDPHVRAHVLTQARRAIDTMHRKGLFHADLNLHNLFVTQAGESFAVAILDLDKARLSAAPLTARRRRFNFARLKRSARKLDPHGLYLDRDAIAVLTAG